MKQPEPLPDFYQRTDLLLNARVFFNVDGVVGAPPAENRREDVLLVQFLLNEIPRDLDSDAPDEVLDACKKVKITGIVDADTIAAIRAFQKSDKHKAIVDGRVSPARLHHSVQRDNAPRCGSVGVAALARWSSGR